MLKKKLIYGINPPPLPPKAQSNSGQKSSPRQNNLTLQRNLKGVSDSQEKAKDEVEISSQSGW